MIKKIILHNIQSHADTEIELKDGVNAIVGSSCAGKTAILRAFYWVVENRPSGTSVLCSNWNKDKKGNPIEEMSATIVTENGFVKRYRNKESNGYIIHYSDGNEVKLEAVKTDVPEEVNKFLNIGDINIQKQMDSPFLLSESAAESARYLNSIVHLDNIDSMLSKAEKNKRDTNSNLKYLQEDIEEKQKQVMLYKNLDEANSLVARIDKRDDEISKIESEIVDLQTDLRAFDDIKDYSEELELIEKIEKSLSDVNDVENEGAALERQIHKFDDVKDYSEELKLIEKIDSFEIPDYSEFEQEIREYKMNNFTVIKTKERIKELKAQMPEVCPLCGKPLGECND